MAKGKIFQLQGPFELNTWINPSLGDDFFIKKLGINTYEGNRVKILSYGEREDEGQIFVIGKTGILEFNEVRIVNIMFLERIDSPNGIDIFPTKTQTALIDYVTGNAEEGR